MNWRRLAVGSGAAMFLCMALGRFSYSAMVPALIEAGRVDAVTAGYIGGANLAGFLLGAFISTRATSGSLGLRLTLAIWAAVAALFASALEGTPLYLGALRAVLGIMTGIVMVQGLSLAAAAAPVHKRAVAASYVFVGVGLGILFSGTAVPASLDHSLTAAWLTVAFAGLLAAALAQWGWRDADLVVRNNKTTNAARIQFAPAIAALAVASFLFSFGIAPHTLYWVDFLARELDLGYTTASWHWTVVGLFAILGPVLVAHLAGLIGNARATIAIYFILCIGIIAPWYATTTISLALSTVIFGAQPAVSTMIAARARDLAEPDQTQAMMRLTIIANGLGSAFGGLGIPWLLDVTGSYGNLFLAGGLAFLIAGLVLCWPSTGSGRPTSTQ